jgi:RNA polymerase sigma-70 factor (ECF subfamily)
MGGDSDFEVWYQREHPVLLRALWAMSGDLDLAADAVDEAFSRALERWDRVSAMESPGGWVHTTAVNAYRRSLRRRALEDRLLRRRRPPMEPVARDLDLALWTAVADLPRRQREVIVLRYVTDLPVAAIADALGITEGGASASLAKARRRLAEAVDVDAEVTRS